jgi:hypothetical protein
MEGSGRGLIGTRTEIVLLNSGWDSAAMVEPLSCEINGFCLCRHVLHSENDF